MNADWYAAAVPSEPVTVLKLRLRPYCLGHEILLTRLGSPFTSGQSPESEAQSLKSDADLRAALLLAALVCSQTWEDACRSLHSPLLGTFLRIWRLRLPFRLKTLDARLRTDLIRFVNYIRAGSWMPEINPPKPGRGRSLKSPWPFRLAVILMRELNLTESEALNLPMARAATYYAALGDLEGTVDLFGAEDQALLDKVAELERKELNHRDTETQREKIASSVPLCLCGFAFAFAGGAPWV